MKYVYLGKAVREDLTMSSKPELLPAEIPDSDFWDLLASDFLFNRKC